MFHGVYVSKGSIPSAVVPFSAEIHPVAGPGCRPGVQTTFSCSPDMLDSLKNVRTAAINQVATSGYIQQTTLWPILAAKPAWPWQIIMLFGLLGCFLYAVGARMLAIWTAPPVPPWLLPGWTLYTLFAALALGGTLLSLPKNVFQLLPLPFSTSKKHLDTFYNDLHNHCFILSVAIAPPTPLFTGPSAGLTAFCAFAHAVHKKTGAKQPIFLPWQQKLVEKIDKEKWVASVDLEHNGNFRPLGKSPDFTQKIQAISNHTEHLELAVFSKDDQSDVERIWQAVALENLEPTFFKKEYRIFISHKKNLQFLFCHDLASFLYYLHPWHRHWLYLRAGIVFSIIILAFFVTPAKPPEFSINCVPQDCTPVPSISDLYSVFAAPGDRIAIAIQVETPGFSGPVSLAIIHTTNIKGISLPFDESLMGELSMRDVQNPMLIFFTMPENEEQVTLFITLQNRAGKADSASLFLIQQTD